MKKAYFASLLIVNILLLIALIANLIFTYNPEIHRAFQNFVGGTGPCIPFNQYWKIYIIQLLLSPLLAIIFMIPIYLSCFNEE